MAEKPAYPKIGSSFISNGNTWKVITIEERCASIFFECNKPDNTDTIELDYASYLFLLKFDFMYELKE